MSNKELIIINPQNDYCDVRGSLYQLNNEQTVSNIIQLLKNDGNKFNRVCVVLDTHLPHHISFNTSWVDGDNQCLKPYSILNNNFVVNGIQYNSAYSQKIYHNAVKSYYLNNKISFMVWPPHCIFGTWGHNLNSQLFQTLSELNCPVWYYGIGRCATEEQYDCIGHDEVNKTIYTIGDIDDFYVCGFMKSHHIYETVKKLIMLNTAEQNKHIYVINDCCTSLSRYQNNTDSNFEKLAIHKLISLVNVNDI